MKGVFSPFSVPVARCKVVLQKKKKKKKKKKEEKSFTELALSLYQWNI